MPPANFAGDYAGGVLMCAIGIMLAIHERHKSGKGQVVDAAMLDGAAYIAWPQLKPGGRFLNIIYFYGGQAPLRDGV